MDGDQDVVIGVEVDLEAELGGRCSAGRKAREAVGGTMAARAIVSAAARYFSMRAGERERTLAMLSKP